MTDAPSASAAAVSIRSYGPADLDAVLQLNNLNVPALSELDRVRCAELATMADAALVAEVDGTFAGFCWVLGPQQPYSSMNYTWFSERYDDFVYLDRIAVAPAFQRCGLGRRFYAELVERFRSQRPVLLCEVNVRPRNDVSLAFHDAIGFREVGQQDTDGGTKTVSMLELRLTTPR